jgi:sortase (surface protein transpeptidase)
MTKRLDAERGAPQERRSSSRRTAAWVLAGLWAVSIVAAVLVLVIQASGAGPVDSSAPEGFDLRAEQTAETQSADVTTTTASPAEDEPDPTAGPEVESDPPAAAGEPPDQADEPAAEEPVGAEDEPVVPVTSGRLEDVAQRHDGPVPVRLVVPSLQVDAVIVPVGYRDGEMDVPPSADLVAWYEFGPTPGEAGSSVLAGHVAWDGRRGVFWDLRELPAGAEFEVHFDDGSVRRFRTVTLTSFGKTDLPGDEIFRRSGDPVLTLITCGGAFNPSIGRYEDNVVAYAVEIDRPME